MKPRMYYDREYSLWFCGTWEWLHGPEPFRAFRQDLSAGISPERAYGAWKEKAQ